MMKASSNLLESMMQLKRLRKTLLHSQIYMLFALLMGVGYGLLCLAASYWLLLVGLVIAGAGFGLLMPNVNVWLVSFVPASVREKFIGSLATSFLLGLLITVAAGFLLYPYQKRG